MFSLKNLARKGLRTATITSAFNPFPLQNNLLDLHLPVSPPQEARMSNSCIVYM